MRKLFIGLIVGVVSLAGAGCVDEGSEEKSNKTADEIREVWTLVQRSDEASIQGAYDLWEGANEAANRQLVDFVAAQVPSPSISQQASWSGIKLPVSWEWWPTGKYPYAATSAVGVCGPDKDLIAKYSNITFNTPSQLRLETNNAVTYAVGTAHGWKLTAYKADNVAKKVEICAGLGPLAGLPIVQNQLASMTLVVK